MLRVRPTTRAIGVLAASVLLIIAGLLIGGKSLIAVGGFLIALIVATYAWVLVPKRKSEAQRTFTPLLPHVGDALVTHLSVAQTQPRTRAGTWSDRMPPGLTGTPAGLVRSAARGEPLVDTAYSTAAAHRGSWTVGPFELTMGDPFGFFTRRSDLGEATPLLIAPAVVRLTGLPNAAVPARTSSDHTSKAASAHGAESLTPREYIPGDSVRRVHWRASAHRGQLMVRQEDRLDSPEATIVLCTRAEPGPGFELAVSACASVAVHLAASDWRVQIVDTSGTELDRGIGLMRTLAQIEPDARASGATRGTRGSTEIFIAVTISLETAKALVPPRGGTGIALVYSLAPEVADALRARGWQLGNIFDGVSNGWGEAL